jgi:hypothetical protein
MNLTTKILTLAAISGFSVAVSSGANASWWNSNNHHRYYDDYYDGPWGYPGYGYGWGRYPGWGGYPGYGWGGQPSRIEIYTAEPQGSRSGQAPKAPQASGIE